MNIDMTRSTIHLARDGLISIRGAQDTRIFCQSGSLWLTLEGDIRDVVLEPGESHAIGNGGLAVITALRPSVALLTQEPPPAAAPRSVGRIVASPELVACD